MRFRYSFIILFTLFCLPVICVFGQIPDKASYNAQLINLKGQEGMNIIINSTSETIILKGTFFNWLPYYETNFNMIIAPGKRDTLKLQYNFPDIAFLNQELPLFNGPGGRVVADIIKADDNKYIVKYSGEYASANNYYHDYFSYINGFDENRPYYDAGQRIENFDHFIPVADS